MNIIRDFQFKPAISNVVKYQQIKKGGQITDH